MMRPGVVPAVGYSMAGSDVVPAVGYNMAGSDVVPLCLWWVYLSDVFHANNFLCTFTCRFCIHASVFVFVYESAHV